MHYYKTVISAIGEEVQALLEGGVLILYSDGAPPELAEVSVLHRVEQASRDVPRIGSILRIGDGRGADGMEQSQRIGPRRAQFQRLAQCGSPWRDMRVGSRLRTAFRRDEKRHDH